MATEREKMLAGELYDSSDAELVNARKLARELCFQLNHSSPSDLDSRYCTIVNQLFATQTNVAITPPFHCDYGCNITLGSNVFFNFNCTILDVAPVNIGDNVLIGPNVQLLTAMHPLDKTTRRKGLEYGKPINIGSDAWLGGGVTVCAGVTIGSGAVIGAGSVVTRDIPDNCVAVGNPCKVIRKLEE